MKLNVSWLRLTGFLARPLNLGLQQGDVGYLLLQPKTDLVNLRAKHNPHLRPDVQSQGPSLREFLQQIVHGYKIRAGGKGEKVTFPKISVLLVELWGGEPCGH